MHGIYELNKAIMKRAAYAAGALALLACAALAFSGQRALKEADRGFLPAPERIREWREMFAADIDAAYAAYLEEAKGLSYNEAHALAHVAGEALYEAEGVEGIARCDETAAYGCYHGLAGAALAAEGPASAGKLGDACFEWAEKGFTCIHGIGHGILAYLGDTKLGTALELCEPINRGISEIGGCYGGVMMEYNFNTMRGGDGVELRAYDDSRFDAPCPDLPAAYQAACYYELPAWWFAVQRTAGAGDDYAPVGALCARVGDALLRGVCYRGVGSVAAPHSAFEPDRIRAACGAMPSAGGKDACLVEALGRLIDTPEGREKLRSFCASPGAHADFCARHAGSL